MSRKQRVVFSADVTVVVDASWSPDCTIAQVMEQAEVEARAVLARMREGAKRVAISPDPKLVRIILDEGLAQ